jgi:hypothetical protein
MTHGLSADQEQKQMPQSFHEIQTCSQERTETMNQHLIPNINKGRQYSQHDMEIAHPASNLTVPN